MVNFTIWGFFYTQAAASDILSFIESRRVLWHEDKTKLTLHHSIVLNVLDGTPDSTNPFNVVSSSKLTLSLKEINKLNLRIEDLDTNEVALCTFNRVED
jgi:hypothetical protein